MDKNLIIILKIFEELKGQFVLNHSYKSVRLVAIGKDEWDYYYITYDGRKLQWESILIGLIPLKGKLDESDYDTIVRSSELNHYDRLICNQSESSEYTLSGYISDLKSEIKLPNELLTEIIFSDK